MTAVVKYNGETIAKIEFYALPRIGDRVKLRNSRAYTVQRVTFVESKDISEVDCISHIEIDVD